jgi:hypothetical protein
MPETAWLDEELRRVVPRRPPAPSTSWQGFLQSAVPQPVGFGRHGPIYPFYQGPELDDEGVRRLEHPEEFR